MNCYLGIDFGTTGARGIVINDEAEIKAEIRYPWPKVMVEELTNTWQTALFTLLTNIPEDLRWRLKAIAINGTSATVLLTDAVGRAIDIPLLYNDARGVSVLEQVKKVAPPQHNVVSATSSLTKLLWMMAQQTGKEGKYFLHQADWLGFLLHGRLGVSDYHNALKLGYDVEELKYPCWLEQLNIPIKLPEILAPGTPVGEVRPDIARGFELPYDCLVCTGTTDSVAAFIASGAKAPGEAVTSLGSTLVIKLLSRSRIEDARYGIYSHRLGELWLAGGASNTGGAVLRQFFTDDELITLSSKINPTIRTSLDYYPLLSTGDRFPINDPNLAPRLEPRPDHPEEFLHGLLAGIARIEAKGYELLQELGADKLTNIYTAGGGASNPVWAAMRKMYLQVPVIESKHSEAAYGTALLAMGGCSNLKTEY